MIQMRYVAIARAIGALCRWGIGKGAGVNIAANLVTGLTATFAGLAFGRMLVGGSAV